MVLIGAVGSFFCMKIISFSAETCQVTIGKPQSTHNLQIVQWISY